LTAKTVAFAPAAETWARAVVLSKNCIKEPLNKGGLDCI
jgi:hypothetical protein